MTSFSTGDLTSNINSYKGLTNTTDIIGNVISPNSSFSVINVDNINELTVNHGININSTVNSVSIIPKATNAYNLGSATQAYSNVYMGSLPNVIPVNVVNVPPNPLVANKLYHGIMTASATWNLPITPADGTVINILDTNGNFSTFPQTLHAGGPGTIWGSDANGTNNYTMNVNNGWYEMMYNTNSNRWTVRINKNWSATIVGTNNTWTGTNTFTQPVVITPSSNQLVLGSGATTINAQIPGGALTVNVKDVSGTGGAYGLVQDTYAQTLNGQLSLTQPLVLIVANNQLVFKQGLVTTTINALIDTFISQSYTVPNIGTNCDFAMTAGNQTINGTKTYTSAIIMPSANLTNTTNQVTLGTTNTVTITSPAPTASRTYTLPDTGANSSFVMTDLAQIINGIKSFTSALTTSNITQFLTVNTLAGGSLRFSTTNTATTNTMNVPFASDTLACLGLNQTFTGNDTFQGTSTFNGLIISNNTINCSGVGVGAVQLSGGLYIARDTLTSGQLFFGIVTSPNTGTGDSCIMDLNNANTNGPKLVAFANGDATNTKKYTMIGPKYLATGRMLALLQGAVSTEWLWPLFVIHDPWSAITAPGVYTVPVSGTYEVKVNASYPVVTNAGFVLIYIYKNPTFGAGPPYQITGGTRLAKGYMPTFTFATSGVFVSTPATDFVNGDTIGVSMIDSANNNPTMLAVENSWAITEII